MEQQPVNMGAHLSVKSDVLEQFASPDFQADPVPFLRWLRDNEPVHRTSKGFYLVSRYADVLWLSDNSRELVRRPERDRMAEQFPSAQRHRSMVVLLDSLVMRNPPEHTRLRRLVSRDFTPRRVDGLQERIGQICDRVLDSIVEPLLDGETIDLHHAWSIPFSLQVLSELLGVPEADRAWLAATVIHISDGIASGDENLMTVSDEKTAQLAGYFQELIAQRRRQPGDDLVSALANGLGPGEDRLADDQLFSLLWLLWLAGFESSASMIDHGVQVLLNQPGQSYWLRGGYPESLAFADEVLRYCVVQLFTPIPRIAAQDLEIAGVPIPAGSDLRPVVAAANRDPAMFPDPDRFDPSRENAVAGFAFGQGMHRCVGAFLARAELAIGLSRIHSRFPALAAAGDLVLDKDIVTTRMTRAFPVALRGQ
jgi:cytochrome P450 family 114